MVYAGSKIWGMAVHRLVSLITALALCGPLASPAEARPGPTVTIHTHAPPHTVFRWTTDRCAANHIPDAPARAFRDASGAVHLIAAHHVNRAMVGPTLTTVRVDCAIRFQGRRSPNPDVSDDLIWLTSFHTDDGRRVVALGHAEFHGHRVPGLCGLRNYMACWRNAVIAAISEDGGRSFSRTPGAAAHVAALPYRYDGSVGRHTGYFSPSNVVRWNGYSYVFIFAEAYREQTRGACLLRSDAPDDPSSWRAWDGRGFTISLGWPGRGREIRNKRTCVPVPGLTSTITSVVRHQRSGVFLALFAGTRVDPATGRRATGIYYVQSPDLIDWSRPKLLVRLPIMFKFTCGVPAVFGYPSLLDPNSNSWTFDSASDSAFLFLTRFNMKDCRLPMDRDLVRLPVRIRIDR